jgi:F-type H+-transporting ATPase subunit b
MATETHAAASEHAQGMPQLDFATFPNQIFWLVVTLVVIYFVMNRIALPRIASVLSERQGAIQGDLDKAEQMKAKAVEAEAVYNKALVDARAEAQTIVAAARAEIQDELDAALAKAHVEIAAKAAVSEAAIKSIRDSAMSAVEEVARDTAGEIVKAIMPGAADAKAVVAAVTARMKG